MTKPDTSYLELMTDSITDRIFNAVKATTTTISNTSGLAALVIISQFDQVFADTTTTSKPTSEVIAETTTRILNYTTPLFNGNDESDNSSYNTMIIGIAVAAAVTTIAAAVIAAKRFGVLDSLLQAWQQYRGEVANLPQVDLEQDQVTSNPAYNPQDSLSRHASLQRGQSLLMSSSTDIGAHDLLSAIVSAKIRLSLAEGICLRKMIQQKMISPEAITSDNAELIKEKIRIALAIQKIGIDLNLHNYTAAASALMVISNIDDDNLDQLRLGTYNSQFIDGMFASKESFMDAINFYNEEITPIYFGSQWEEGATTGQESHLYITDKNGNLLPESYLPQLDDEILDQTHSAISDADLPEEPLIISQARKEFDAANDQKNLQDCDRLILEVVMFRDQNAQAESDYAEPESWEVRREGANPSSIAKSISDATGGDFSALLAALEEGEVEEEEEESEDNWRMLHTAIALGYFPEEEAMDHSAPQASAIPSTAPSVYQTGTLVEKLRRRKKELKKPATTEAPFHRADESSMAQALRIRFGAALGNSNPDKELPTSEAPPAAAHLTISPAASLVETAPPPNVIAGRAKPAIALKPTNTSARGGPVTQSNL